MTGGTTRTAPVQAGLAEEVAIRELRSFEGPVAGIHDAIRRTRHDPGLGKDHAQQVCLGLDPRVEPALVATSLDGTRIAIAVDHPVESTNSDLAVQPIATQINQLTSALVNPRLDREIHRSRPVLRMRGNDQHLISVKVERAVVELSFRIIIVGEIVRVRATPEAATRPVRCGRRPGPQSGR